MLGAIASSRAERPETFFRYSVKCDRVTASRIETAAKKAGLTVNAFVQQHFDAILEPKPNPLTQGDGGSRASDAAEFSRRHKVSIPAARVWAALAARVDAEGLARVSMAQLGRDTDIAGSYPQRLIAALDQAGMVEVIEEPTPGRVGLYRIVWEG